MWAFLGEFPAAGLAITSMLDAVQEQHLEGGSHAQRPVPEMHTGDAADR